MAINTENKRRSVPNFLPFTLLPVSDGTIGVYDRVQVSGLYSGITPSVPALVVTDYTLLGLENEKFYLGDFGHVLYVFVGLPLATALDINLKIKKPDGTLVNWVPTIYTFGTVYNYLTYTIADGDLDQVGLWELQSYVEFANWTGRGNTINFQVWDIFT